MLRRARRLTLRLRKKIFVAYALCICASYCIGTLMLMTLEALERNQGRTPDGPAVPVIHRRRIVRYARCPWDDTLTNPEFVRSAGGCNGSDSEGIGGRCESVITCPKLLIGDRDAVRAAAELTSRYERSSLTDEQVLEMASDCSSLYDRGRYEPMPLRPTDVEFPIAFNLLLHVRAEQFERLLRAIYRPQNVYCVHVDAKSSRAFYEAVAAVAKCFGNVFVSTARQHVVYAGFSRLKVREIGYIRLKVFFSVLVYIYI